MNEVLEQIKTFADEAHGDQQRKYRAERYIMHPLRVMQLCEKQGASLAVLAAALLHDVLEDTVVSKNVLHSFLRAGMDATTADKTMQLVTELTDIYTKAAYPRWNRRKRKAKEAARIEQTSAEAQTIKYADIIDNCTDIVTSDPDFAGVFLRECNTLLKKMHKGNAVLREQALSLVTAGLQQLAQSPL